MGLYGNMGSVIELVFCRHPWQTLAVCWLWTPGMMILLAPLMESRWLPLLRNSKAFFPGDAFLGLALALAVKRLIPTLPSQGWWQHPWWMYGVTIVMAVFTAVMMFVVDGPRYQWAQRLSPTKLWHDLGCYFVWGTALVTVLVPCLIAGEGWQSKGMIGCCLLAYLGGVVVDAHYLPDLDKLHQPWNFSWLKMALGKSTGK